MDGLAQPEFWPVEQFWSSVQFILVINSSLNQEKTTKLNDQYAVQTNRSRPEKIIKIVVRESQWTGQNRACQLRPAWWVLLEKMLPITEHNSQLSAKEWVLSPCGYNSDTVCVSEGIVAVNSILAWLRADLVWRNWQIMSKMIPADCRMARVFMH